MTIDVTRKFLVSTVKALILNNVHDMCIMDLKAEICQISQGVLSIHLENLVKPRLLEGSYGIICLVG